MGQGRPPGRRLLVPLVCAAFAVPSAAVAFSGTAPPHPVSGKWRGHNGEHAKVEFRVSNGQVLDFYTGLNGAGGVTFDKAEIKHGHFSGEDDGGTFVTGTFERPSDPTHHSRHVIGTLYPPSGGSRPVRIGFKAHPADH